MKFLIDAQLPRRLTYRFRDAGQEATHTLDLPDGNRTADETIAIISEAESCILVTKDADFVESFVLFHRPPQLLLISTGNISNNELEALLVPLIPIICDSFSTYKFIEVNRESIVYHE